MSKSSGKMSSQTSGSTCTPSNNMLKLARSLFNELADQESFLERLCSPQPVGSALLWLKPRAAAPDLPVLEALDWQPEFVDRLAVEARPGKNALHAAGAYYCLDFSSVFSASALLAAQVDLLGCDLVLDVCSAPGGKAIFAARALQPKRLICNEVIHKRTAQLYSNLKRCGISQAEVLTCDSSKLAELYESAAQLVIVDAPCSGQSLVARGENSGGCFHPSTINMNSNRQKRILANSLKCVEPGGYLAYMTCTFSKQENEVVMGWALERFPAFRVEEVKHLSAYRSAYADFPCYRLFPQSGLGAGAFVCLLRRQN